MTHSDNHYRHEAFWAGRVSAMIPLLLFAWIAFQIPVLATGERILFVCRWVPSLGVDITFALDGLSGLYGLIITGIGALVMVYADAYLVGHSDIAKFYIYLHLFLLSMLGLVLSDNLMVLFVFWELTTLFSFLLIGFEHDSESSRSSARQALLVTGGGGLLLLTGILLAAQAGGTYGLEALREKGDLLRQDSLYVPMLVCMIIGAFTKSAQFPFHFWLPNAMTAPTPISAFLHSATMVKAGLYLMTRLHPILGGTMVWMSTLVFVGALTAVWGSVVALGQKDLKAILAHTTIMALGIVMMFLGGRTTPALTAAMTFLLVHALYKSALFMVVGNVDHQTGTRNIQEIGGIGRFMPATAAAAAMAALSMAGFPLFLGFIGKEIMYKGALTETVFPELAVAAALTANALMTAIAASLSLRPFWGRPRGSKAKTEVPWQMLLGPLLLSGIGLGFGLIPDWVGHWLIRPAVLAFHPTTEHIELKLFHGVNEPLLLSLATLCLGTLIFWQRQKIRRMVSRLTGYLPMSMADAYDRVLQGIVWLADRQTRTLQNGSLFRYLAIILSVLLVSVGWAAWPSGDMVFQPNGSSFIVWQWMLILLMLISVVLVVGATSRLLAICALGVIGAGIALIFLSFGAPDVALTQLLVETLTLIIASIVLLRLPRISLGHRSGSAHRVLRILLAAGCGLMVTGLLIMVGQHDIDRTLTEFYEKASYVKAHGRNIVNVILVDFRGLDTLGEIIVVATSAIAGVALIRKEKDGV